MIKAGINISKATILKAIRLSNLNTVKRLQDTVLLPDKIATAHRKLAAFSMANKAGNMGLMTPATHKVMRDTSKCLQHFLSTKRS